jgi:peptidyl-prolyl cis-trans isomerase C
MNLKHKLTIFAATLCLGAGALLAADSKGLDSLFPDEVLVKGKGFEVKQSKLDNAFTQFRANLAARNQQFPEARRAATEAQLLERMVVTEMLLLKATPEDKEKAKVSAGKISENTRKESPTPESFARQLRAVGLTEEQFEAQILERAICEEVITREVRSQFTISDDDAKKFYDENPVRFDVPERVKVTHILIANREPTGQEYPPEVVEERRKKAEKLLADIRKGADFVQLVKEHTDDRVSRDRDGEYTFPRGKMAPEFEAASFALAPGQISDIVTTQYGFHIIKCLEKFPVSKLAFDEVKERIKDQLGMEEVQKRLPEYFEKLKKDMEVTYSKNAPQEKK